MKINDQRKIALVYDWIDKWGGIERVLLNLHAQFPKADFYTSYFNPKNAPWAKDLPLTPSFMQKLPRFITSSRALSTPLYPFAFESFDFKGYDVVISITSSFAKSVITRPETLHVCYLLTPTRFLWHENKSTARFGVFKKLLQPYISYLKRWDSIVAKRPDKYLVISNAVQKRLRDIYHLDGEVLYPPFDTKYWSQYKSQNKRKNRDYYLVVSRLEPYKNVDAVIDAFKRIPDKNIIIIGTGSQEGHLKNIAGNNCTFVKKITDAELARYYEHAKALIMIQEEDFGYTALEAQFFGCPVIAFAKGGALEIVLDGKTGILLESNTPQALIEAIEKFEKISYTFENTMDKYTKTHLDQFSPVIFKEKIDQLVSKSL